MTVVGTNFVSNSVVRWNGADRPTTFLSPTQLTASVPFSDLAAAATVSVTVFNPAPGGGTSNALLFPITKPGTSAPELANLTFEVVSGDSVRYQVDFADPDGDIVQID